MDGKSLACILNKEDDAKIFLTLGIHSFGKVVKLKESIRKEKACRDTTSPPLTPVPSPSGKPTSQMLALANEEQVREWKIK